MSGAHEPNDGGATATARSGNSATATEKDVIDPVTGRRQAGSYVDRDGEHHQAERGMYVDKDEHHHWGDCDHGCYVDHDGKHWTPGANGRYVAAQHEGLS